MAGPVPFYSISAGQYGQSGGPGQAASRPMDFYSYDDLFGGIIERDGVDQEALVRDPKENVVQPIPIGNFPEGCSSAFEPLSGFEHTFHPEAHSRDFIPLPAPAPSPQQEKAAHVITNEEDKIPEGKPPRRTRRSRLDIHTTAEAATSTFHIGDLEALKEFIRTRLRELTAKPLRLIVAEWIKLAEPDRRGKGPYSKIAPMYDRKGDYPAWWPRHVRYGEPGHLRSDELCDVSIELLLLHQRLDRKSNPRTGWTSELAKRAIYLLEQTPTDKFAAGDIEYNQAMKDRALKAILPDLFRVAQVYENLVAPLKLWERPEGPNGAAIPLGPSYTWKPIVRPAELRKKLGPCKEPQQKKRLRQEASPDREESSPRKRILLPASNMAVERNRRASISDAESQGQNDAKPDLSMEDIPGSPSTIPDSPALMSAAGSFSSMLTSSTNPPHESFWSGNPTPLFPASSSVTAYENTLQNPYYPTLPTVAPALPPADFDLPPWYQAKAFSSPSECLSCQRRNSQFPRLFQ